MQDISFGYKSIATTNCVKPKNNNSYEAVGLLIFEFINYVL